MSHPKARRWSEKFENKFRGEYLDIREKGGEGWLKLHNEEINILNYSPNRPIIRLIKSKTVVWETCNTRWGCSR
jgi:hypothetical protein